MAQGGASARTRVLTCHIARNMATALNMYFHVQGVAKNTARRAAFLATLRDDLDHEDRALAQQGYGKSVMGRSANTPKRSASNGRATALRQRRAARRQPSSPKGGVHISGTETQ